MTSFLYAHCLLFKCMKLSCICARWSCFLDLICFVYFTNLTMTVSCGLAYIPSYRWYIDQWMSNISWIVYLKFWLLSAHASNMHSSNAVTGALIETVTVLLTLGYTTKSLGGIFNTQIAELHSQSFWLSLSWDQKICISNNLLSDADAADPGTTLWEPLV